MAIGSTYDFGAALAQLTCILEDATASAVESQSSQNGDRTRRRLASDLERQLGEANMVLNEIKATLA